MIYVMQLCTRILLENLSVSFTAFTVWEYPPAIPHEVMKKQKVISIMIKKKSYLIQNTVAVSTAQ